MMIVLQLFFCLFLLQALITSSNNATLISSAPGMALTADVTKMANTSRLLLLVVLVTGNSAEAADKYYEDLAAQQTVKFAEKTRVRTKVRVTFTQVDLRIGSRYASSRNEKTWLFPAKDVVEQSLHELLGMSKFPHRCSSMRQGR